ncbi:MAG: FAD-dependent oxidoreductase [Pseudomonadota bacterium]|nr:FAD-dependent oxidoreductase [Pseudomonadota bacterium]
MLPLNRRRLLGAGAGAFALAGCRDPTAAPLDARWVGASHERGHRLRQAQTLPAAAVQRRAAVLVVGTGVAGLAAARAFAQQGIDDVQLLELEDSVGGNSRSHAIGAIGCPLGAHYLPVPPDGSPAREVQQWLHEIGLLRTTLGRTVADERHLCFSPQERLFFDGTWVEGLLPPAAPGSATLQQYRRFAEEVMAAQRVGFALPSLRAPWTPAHAALDAETFADWLARKGLNDPQLRWYLDYCCRDDFGAPARAVSAWAGLHYFASRHGFHAPGDDSGEREPVWTWPEGNAWLARRLAAPFADRTLTGRTVLRVAEKRHGVMVSVWDEAASQVEQWTAGTVVLALPLFVAARLIESPSNALKAASASLSYAPWLVANVPLASPLLHRTGAPPSWDNVPYDPRPGATTLGYVDAMHQSLRTAPGATVLSFYRTLPPAARAGLLHDSAAQWAQLVLADAALMHPDLPARARRVDLMRWGHAMAIPAPGVRGSPAIAALRAQRGRVRHAHSDLCGTSVFEEAFTVGTLVAVR